MKKVLAIMLVCFMLVSLLPMGALAEEIETKKCPGEDANHYLSNCTNVFVRHEPGKCGGYAYDVYKCEGCGEYFAVNFEAISGEHQWVVDVEADCEEAGKRHCEICKTEEKIDALGHKPAGGATCVDDSICERCGKELAASTGKHTWGKKPASIDEEKMVAIYECDNCDATKEVVILNHICEDNLVDVEAQAPTCTEEGWTAHKMCTICEETFGKETLPAHGHGEPEAIKSEKTLQITNYSLYVTFDFSGLTKFTNLATGWEGIYVYDGNGDYIAYLSAGKSTELDIVAGVEYEFYSFYNISFKYELDVMEIVVEGDCFTDGSRTWQCSLCHEQITENTGKNHDYELIHNSEPTCTELGWSIWACKNPECGDHFAESTPALGHSARPEELPVDMEYELVGYDENWNDVYDWVVVRENPVAPTCTKDGYYYWYCTHEYYDEELGQMVQCGEEQREPIPATGCDLKTVTVEATCTEYGYSYTYCTKGRNCDCEDKSNRSNIYVEISDEETYYINLGTYVYGIHSWEIDIAGGKDMNNHNDDDREQGMIRKENCTESGLYIYWCTDCEADVVESVPALGHDWDTENVLTKESSCLGEGYIYVECKNCDEINVLEPLPGIEVKPYYSMEEAEAGHGELALIEIFRPGTCDVVGLYRYQCQDCKEYLLVKDETTGHHIVDEDRLLGRYDENNAPAEAPVANAKYEGNGESSFSFTVPTDGEITFTLVSVDGNVDVADEYVVMYLYLDGRNINNFWLEVPYGSSATVPTKTVEVSKGELTIEISRSYHDYVVEMSYEGSVPKQEFKAQAPDCENAGWTAQYYCDRCGEFVPCTELNALGHKEVVDIEAKNPTCTEVGCTKGSHCEICGEILNVSEEIPALGHDHVLTDHLLPEDRKESDEYTYKHFECTRCEEGHEGHEYIIDYVTYCDHVLITRPIDIVESTCETLGYKEYKCRNCDYTEKVYDEAMLPHENAAGQDLSKCHPSITDFKCVNGCKKEFAKVEHELNAVHYDANCLVGEHLMINCLNCDFHAVEQINDELGDHSWSDWAPVVDDNGVIVAETCACRVCGEVDIRDVETIAYSAEIEGAITDGSLVKVVIAISGDEDFAWGFKLNVAYSENLKFVEAKFVTTSFTYANVATNHEGYVTILANADGEVELNGKENLVELYFTVNAPEVSEIAVGFASVETLDAEGKPVEFVAYGDTAETVKLMDLDLDGEVTLADALAAYNVITAAGYNVAADLDGDGAVTLVDYLNLFNYLSGALTYEEVVALR